MHMRLERARSFEKITKTLQEQRKRGLKSLVRKITKRFHTHLRGTGILYTNASQANHRDAKSEQAMSNMKEREAESGKRAGRVHALIHLDRHTRV